MAKRTVSNYTFNAAAKTITLTDFTSIRLESILLITNVTRGVVIYQLTDSLKGGTVATNVLTLTFNTASQANADSLNIVFEDFNVSGGFVSVANSTATNLALNAVFTGTSEDVSVYSNIKVSIFSSHASATDGLQIQQSPDNINWDSLDVYTIPATSGKNFSVPVNFKFFRIVYTNGATATTSFRLQVIFSTNDKQPSSVRPQDGRGNDNDHVEVLSSLMGYNSTANAWNRIGISNATTGGNENLIDRIKINASLRMIDNAQPSGSKLVGVTGTQATGLDVNIKNTSLPVTGTFFQATQPVSNSSDADTTSTGTLAAAAQTVILTMGGKSASAVTISGTWVGTITFEGSVNGTNFDPINAVAASTSSPQPTTTVNGLYRLSPAGLLQIRAIMTTYTSGTASISMRASTGTGAIFANQILPSKITDGTNTVTIKPASTASVVADFPLVVALHPSSTTPNFATAQSVTGTFFQATQPVSLATNTPVIASGANSIGNINELRAATLAVTVTAAAGTAATLTLPAVAGQFHYITALDIVLYSAAARTGSATPNIVTTTNLSGAIAFTFSTAGAIGTTDIQDLVRVTPLKSSTVNTATTVVAPIAAGGIWRITATYFTGA